MKAHSCLVLLVAAVAAFAGDVAAPAGPHAPPALPKQGPFAVIKVVDGDTIEVAILAAEGGHSEKVRLLGIDAAEIGQPYHDEATLWLTNLLKGEQVFLARDALAPERDIYNRVLAYVSRAPEGLDVNREAIRQGYALVYDKDQSSRREELAAVMAAARAAGRGLHNQAPPIAPAARRPDLSRASVPVEPDITVYATRTGSKYHAGGCRYLSKSSIPLSLKDAKARGLTPCSVCGPPL